MAPLCVAALALTACGSAPADVADGTYRALAASVGSTVPDAEVEVAGSTLTFTSDGTTVTATAQEGSQDYVLCPPDARGRPQPLGDPLTLGDLTLEQPAVFGDCGVTAPVRITLVDLNSASGEGGFPFDRWIEFCDTNDPDC